MPLLVLVLLAGIGFLLYTRSQEVFCVSIRDGRLLLVRGECPHALLQDIADVMERAGVQRATVRAIKTSGGSRLVTDGVDDGVGQRLRNVFGAHPVHLRRSPDTTGARRNLGQVLGITWLAWALVGRSER